jgi:hypothetical protein
VSKNRPTTARWQKRYLSRDEVIAIYRAAGQQQNIAADFDVSCNTVSHIKNGHRHLDITAPYRLAAKVNASLVSMACGVPL